MEQVFITTLSKVTTLLVFISMGYLLRRTKTLPKEAAIVLSNLVTMVFNPAYTVRNLASTMSPEKVGKHIVLVGYGLIVLVAIILLANLLAKFMARDDFERRSYIYAFSIPNFGYFAFPLVENVFGQEVLGQLMLFCLPMNIACYTYGYLLFVRDAKLSVIGILKKPMILSILAGCVLGLLQVELPSLVDDILKSAGNCMSPSSMLLAGFVLSSFSLKDLFKGARSYLITAIRLVGIPAFVAAVLWLLGVRGIYLALPIMIFSIPLGLNMVVFPESIGVDASNNARMCFVCNLFTIVTIPIIYSLLALLM